MIHPFKTGILGHRLTPSNSLMMVANLQFSMRRTVPAGHECLLFIIVQSNCRSTIYAVTNHCQLRIGTTTSPMSPGERESILKFDGLSHISRHPNKQSVWWAHILIEALLFMVKIPTFRHTKTSRVGSNFFVEGQIPNVVLYAFDSIPVYYRTPFIIPFTTPLATPCAIPIAFTFTVPIAMPFAFPFALPFAIPFAIPCVILFI